MRRFGLIISILLLGAFSGRAQSSIPSAAGDNFPVIRASLEDGFYSLAELQVRAFLRTQPTVEESEEVTLLLAHALWGRKQYEQVLELLEGVADSARSVYWRGRALYELKRYDEAHAVLSTYLERGGAGAWDASILRLKGRVEELSGMLADAESSYRLFAEQYPDHAERVDNQFDLASVCLQQGRTGETISIYEALLQESELACVWRAQLALGSVLADLGDEESRTRAQTLLSALGDHAEVAVAFRIDAYVELANLQEQFGEIGVSKQTLLKAVDLAPDARLRVRLERELVNLHLRDGEFEAALKRLEMCRAEAPDETVAMELQLEKANALLQAGQFAEAEAAYQVYLDVADDPAGVAHAYWGKALALWGRGRYPEAAMGFDKAVDVLAGAIDRADALIKAGDSYFKADRMEEAGKRYRRFIADYPEHSNMPHALYHLGLVLAKLGQRPEALEVFQRTESEYAASSFAEAAALRIVDIYRTNGAWEEALEKYAQIGNTYTNRATVALSWHQRGVLLFKYFRRYGEAQAAFEKVLNEYPESENAPQAAYMYGFCLYAQGEVDEAIRICTEFVEKSPDSEWTPDVMFWLAERSFNRGEYKEAEALFMRISDAFRTHRLAPRALYWAGRSAAAESNYVIALERYGTVVSDYPDCDILPQTRFYRGDALTQLGRFSEAVTEFDGIIESAPESPLANTARGRKGDCLFSLADGKTEGFEAAMAAYQAILDRPSAPAALKMQAEYKVGRCLEKMNLLDKAFSRYMNVVYPFVKESTERTPYSVVWFTRSAFGAAAIKERMHDWVAVVKVYERVIEAQVPAAEEALKRIEKIKNENWLLFQETKEADDVGTDG